ncbi:MAG TPA: RNA methyltransferase [Bacteroidetes bacterium]|nr:RNA methyltransferase [Bacteroidota bacterium]
MKMHKQITSLQNPLVKQAVQIKNKARERKARQLFLAEGLREVGLALQNGFAASCLFYDPSLTGGSIIQSLVKKAERKPESIIAVSTAVMGKIAYRSSVTNVVGLFKNPISVRSPQSTVHSPQSAVWSEAEIPNLLRGGNPLYLVLEGIEKPGNLGAILRTADAAGADGIFLCEPKFDLYNPNAIRASLGAIFTLPIFEMPSEEAAAFFKNNNIPVYATWLEAAKPLYECDLKGAAALVLGAEATGISPFWLGQADQRIIIPMSGQVDSLNVSTSAAIVLFEAVRQRNQSLRETRV